LGVNAYANKLGLFKNRVIPVCTYLVATEPLSESQWESIGWKNQQGLADARVNFSYAVPTVDGRIVIGGGGDVVYYPKDRLSSGNEKTATRNILNDLFTTFPQLEGLEIEHAWGGTTALTVDRTPSVGTLNEYANIYYGGAYDEGVPTGQTAGRIIADLMADESNKFTNHYLVNRKIPYAGPVMTRGFFFNAYRKYLQYYD
jgi:glycine/D-amino acid oxidase-like deaminating enzyme